MTRCTSVSTTGALIALALCASASSASTTRWTEQKAQAWYAQQPWLVGSNYVPGSAINQLEMWQEATFAPEEIDRELGWAEAMGMNTMRVFLHDLLWEQDAAGFRKRIDQFLTIASRHHIRGTPCRGWARSIHRRREFTTQAGCRVPARRRWPTRSSIRG